MVNWTVTRTDRIMSTNPILFQDERKWVTLSNNNLSLMPLLDADVDMLSNTSYNSKNTFTVGDIYSLGKESVEGIEFDKLYFILHGIVKEYKGYPLNSLIVREVSISEDGTVLDNVNRSGRKKFSIPPAMCKLLGIKYCPGFELWPISSGFERVNLSKLKNSVNKIDYGNMSTYPTSDIDGTIRKIILELHGFSAFNASHIITPTGAMIPTDKFISSLTIFARQNISTDNGCAGFKIGERFLFKIVTRGDKKDNVHSIADDKHNIYLEVDLTKKSLNANTPDGIIGISHTALDGKDIDDVIGVKWDESADENSTFAKMAEYDVSAVFESLSRHFNNVLNNKYVL